MIDINTGLLYVEKIHSLDEYSSPGWTIVTRTGAYQNSDDLNHGLSSKILMTGIP